MADPLWTAILRLGLATVAIALVGFGFLWWQRRHGGATTRQVEVIDRAFLSRGVSVALLRVGERRLLVGVSGDGVRLLRDLDRAPREAEESFADALAVAEATR